MGENNFDKNVEALFKGLEGMVSSKTVVGDAVKFEDGTVILPLVDINFGMGVGSFLEQGKKDNGAGALGGKIQPSAILVMKDGQSKLVNVKNQDGLTKILDMIPDFVDRFSDKKDKKKESKKKENVEE